MSITKRNLVRICLTFAMNIRQFLRFNTVLTLYFVYTKIISCHIYAISAISKFLSISSVSSRESKDRVSS